MELYKKRRYAKGARIDQVAKDLGLEKSSVYENLTICEKVIPDLQELFYNGKLTRKAVIRFQYFDFPTQEWLYNGYKDKLTEAKVKKLKKHMSRQDIEEILNSSNTKQTKRVTCSIPEDRVDDFQKFYEQWLKGNVTLILEEGSN
jgi:hypothetical protein